MRKITTGEARNRFADVVNEAAYSAERTIITRHGKGVAAVVPISDMEVLHEIERIIDVEEARQVLANAGDDVVSLEDLKKELGIG